MKKKITLAPDLTLQNMKNQWQKLSMANLGLIRNSSILSLTLLDLASMIKIFLKTLSLSLCAENLNKILTDNMISFLDPEHTSYLLKILLLLLNWDLHLVLLCLQPMILLRRGHMMCFFAKTAEPSGVFKRIGEEDRNHPKCQDLEVIRCRRL